MATDTFHWGCKHSGELVLRIRCGVLSVVQLEILEPYYFFN